ncbi:MAG: HAMP domain-containing histidine kinase [Bacteriovorax sp.]|nr:HAMP domain-containing histidine kinase [Bacteriovorax sp.]
MSNPYSAKHIDAWLEQAARGLPSEGLACLFGDTLKNLSKRASLTLNKNTLMAIFKRVIYRCGEKYPVLSGLKVESFGIPSDQFSIQFSQVDPSELKEAFGFLITELITILSNLTADILPASLEEQKASSEMNIAANRLENLYEISKCFAGFESLENTFPEIFMILANTFSFQTILLLEKKGGTCVTTAWYDANTSKERMMKAIEYSLRSFEYLVSPLTKVAGEVEETYESISKYALPICSLELMQVDGENFDKFITLPLTLSSLETFGVLQFETVTAMNESDLRFVSALSNLIAVALDRFNKEHGTQQLRQVEINERIRELVQAQEYVKNLEKERDLRDQFVSILTHDLRTPLTAAKMAAQVILRQPKNIEKNQILASKVVRSIDRMDQMIKDLLDANRIRAGEPLSFTMNECDLRLIALTTLRDLGLSYGDRFMLETDRESINGYWNEEAIRRVIENLVNNAVKYGSPQQLISVALKQLDNKVEISVHNIGNPIPLADQVNLFQPFHRTSSAQCGEKKGWGLGLTLVRGVAEAHGGFVKVQSNESEGTSFIVTIPRDSRPFQMLN